MIPMAIITLALAGPVLLLICGVVLVFAAMFRSKPQASDGMRLQAMERAWRQLDRIEDRIAGLESALMARSERNGL